MCQPIRFQEQVERNTRHRLQMRQLFGVIRRVPPFDESWRHKLHDSTSCPSFQVVHLADGITHGSVDDQLVFPPFLKPAVAAGGRLDQYPSPPQQHFKAQRVAELFPVQRPHFNKCPIARPEEKVIPEKVFLAALRSRHLLEDARRGLYGPQRRMAGPSLHGPQRQSNQHTSVRCHINLFTLVCRNSNRVLRRRPPTTV